VFLVPALPAVDGDTVSELLRDTNVQEVLELATAQLQLEDTAASKKAARVPVAHPPEQAPKARTITHIGASGSISSHLATFLAHQLDQRSSAALRHVPT
jgi:hypothetical protein